MDFVRDLKSLNIELTEEQNKQFEIYFNELVRVNEYMNLTAIVDKEQVYLKHFYDSLTITRALTCLDSFSLIDVGSGAGFPSIPLAICFPNINVTIVDALNKRINFLNELILKLGLTNVRAIHARAEEFAIKNREVFDVATARAVARLNVLSELCLPLVKVGGKFIAMKSQETDAEVLEASKAILTLGGTVTKVDVFTLPYDAGMRSIITINKTKTTPAKYPRAFAKIKDKPL